MTGIGKENKMSNNNLVIMKDNKSSIKVAQNAKGIYSFEVKTYYDETETDALKVVEHNKQIMCDLHKEFK